MLPEITRKLGVPRALEVPYPLGFPFGEPGDTELQRSILRQALRLVERGDTPFIAELSSEVPSG